MKIIAPVVLAALFAACGGMPPDGSSQAGIGMDQPAPNREGLFPKHLRQNVIRTMAPAPEKRDGATLNLLPRFAALCDGGSVTVVPGVEGTTFTLAFQLGLLTLDDQQVLRAGALEVTVVKRRLLVTLDGAPIAQYQLWIPPQRARIEITVDGHTAAVALDGRLIGQARRDIKTFKAELIQFGGQDAKRPGMCGGIDNVWLRDARSVNIDGRLAEPANATVFNFSFDGPAANTGRGDHHIVFDGLAGLLNN